MEQSSTRTAPSPVDNPTLVHNPLIKPPVCYAGGSRSR